MILLFFFFFLLSSFSSKSYGADTLETGKSIRDGESIISAGEVFELGFFSPGSSKNRYVGIWYSKISVQTVVWVVNKENPVRDRSGSFSVRDDGSIAVLDGESKVLWSSNASTSTNDTSAQLLDTGNFMVRSHASGDVWQSFDHPGDTFLAGMKVGLDLRTNVSTVIVSSKSTEDPSSGTFSIGMDPRRSTQLMMRDGETPVWRSGPWDGQVFIGIQSMRSTQYRYGFKFSNEWSNGNWSGGCSRRIPLECQKNSSNTTEQRGDGFLKLKRLKLPRCSSI